MKKKSEQILWNLFREGDRKAFENMFLKFNPILFTIGLKMTSDRSLIEDSIHEVFIDLWNKRSRLPEVDTVKYYLIVCYRRMLLLYLKESNRNVDINEQSFVLVDSEEYKQIEDQLNTDTISKLKHAIEELPSRQKEIIELRFMKSMSYDEIQEIMEINYTSSRKLVYKAINNLKKHLKGNSFNLVLILALLS
ncbi:sigma-70 family RNA polymerase sigma factor [Reichenbachiella sp. MALMAid0571]|uniref:RNA polymerase sigma factor n=1 Tax=Reichenbachiella sp. MALMAid0571 TaxID=3143939 RepID=UPI0032DE5EBA